MLKDSSLVFFLGMTSLRVVQPDLEYLILLTLSREFLSQCSESVVLFSDNVFQLVETFQLQTNKRVLSIQNSTSIQNCAGVPGMMDIALPRLLDLVPVIK
jgi:hypothetical protein